MTSQQDKVAAGKKSFSKVVNHSQVVWEEDWENVIAALKIGRDKAMRAAGLNQGDKPAGKLYSNAFSEWLNENQWSYSEGGPGPTTRAACLKCADHLVAIRRWRQAQIQENPDKSLLYDHPQKVWARFNADTNTEKTVKKKKKKAVIVDLEKLVEQFGSLEEADRVEVIAEAMEDFEVGDVCRILNNACSEDALAVIADDIYREQKRSVLVKLDESPKGIATILQHELGWTRQQVRDVISACEDVLPNLPENVVPITSRVGRGSKKAADVPVEPTPPHVPGDDAAAAAADGTVR